MTDRKELLSNYIAEYAGKVRFGNSNSSPILGHGDIVCNNVTIKDTSYVEGLSHNLFSIGQFCDKGNTVTFKAKQ